MEYTFEQQKIFEHNPSKHACILAGPGTGKSSTIISYIAKIREQHPHKVIRLLTFTRAANGELVDKILEAGHKRVISSTVHSFAISVLLNNPGTGGLPEPLRIADDWEWKELIREDIARRLSSKAKTIDRLKNEMSAYWESLSPETDHKVPANVRARFMGMWDEHRKIFGYTLLAELPFRLKIALEGNPDLDLGNLELIAVDEYQDLNACDLMCFRLLSERDVTVIAIGDDDQSIYQFRKAHPAGIRNFPNEYQAPSYPLTISHRCGKKILEWANYVIEGDTSRASKPSLKPSDKNSEGVVGYLVFDRENTEAYGVVRLVTWLTNKEKVPLEEILILVRTGIIAKLIKEALEKAHVQFSDPEEALNTLQNISSRELFSILRLLTNRCDSLAWWTLLHHTKGIGYSIINNIYGLAQKNKCQFGEALVKEAESDFKNISSGKDKISTRVNSVFQILERLNVPCEARWGAWIMERVKEGKLPEPPEGIGELLSKIDTAIENTEYVTLDRYVNQVEPMTKDIMNSKIPDRLRIMTLSRSKGLTVRATIIVGAESEIIPHPSGDPQEERRLLYVGMTRARDYLFVTRCRRRTGPTAWSGQANVAGTRTGCPFLDGGPVSQSNGEQEFNKVDAKNLL
ncbi:MAG TPA: ATP-dependent helicase [Candidatus Brocadiia bacterium]|nr:ATP-dependent helicase [Candidatus Brocadiales bacterium]